MTKVLGCEQVYCQPIYEACDKTFGNILAPTWNLKNTVVRLICRTVFICLCILVSSPNEHSLVCAWKSKPRNCLLSCAQHCSEAATVAHLWL